MSIEPYHLCADFFISHTQKARNYSTCLPLLLHCPCGIFHSIRALTRISEFGLDLFVNLLFLFVFLLFSLFRTKSGRVGPSVLQFLFSYSIFNSFFSVIKFISISNTNNTVLLTTYKKRLVNSIYYRYLSHKIYYLLGIRRMCTI